MHIQRFYNCRQAATRAPAAACCFLFKQATSCDVVSLSVCVCVEYEPIPRDLRPVSEQRKIDGMASLRCGNLYVSE